MLFQRRWRCNEPIDRLCCGRLHRSRVRSNLLLCGHLLSVGEMLLLQMSHGASSMGDIFWVKAGKERLLVQLAAVTTDHRTHRLIGRCDPEIRRNQSGSNVHHCTEDGAAQQIAAQR